MPSNINRLHLLSRRILGMIDDNMKIMPFLPAPQRQFMLRIARRGVCERRCENTVLCTCWRERLERIEGD